MMRAVLNSCLATLRLRGAIGSGYEGLYPLDLEKSMGKCTLSYIVGRAYKSDNASFLDRRLILDVYIVRYHGMYLVFESSASIGRLDISEL